MVLLSLLKNPDTFTSWFRFIDVFRCEPSRVGALI